MVVDPGEMDTRMHRDAFGADHDPTRLERPGAVAARIVAMLEDERRAPSGARLEVARWEVAS